MAEAEVVVEVEVAGEVVVAVEQPLQAEESTQMRNYWEENPNTLKETDETSIDSSQILSPTVGSKTVAMFGSFGLIAMQHLTA